MWHAVSRRTRIWPCCVAPSSQPPSGWAAHSCWPVSVWPASTKALAMPPPVGPQRCSTLLSPLPRWMRLCSGNVSRRNLRKRYSSANCIASSLPFTCLQALCSYCAQHTLICCNISWRPMSRNWNWWRPHGAMCAPSLGCCGCHRWWPAWWPGWIAFIAVSSCPKLSLMPHSPFCSSSCSPSVTFARTLLSVILDRGMRSGWALPQFPCGTPSSRASWSLSPSSCSCSTSECWPWMCVQERESDIMFCFWFLSFSLPDSTYSASPSEIQKSFRSAAHLLATGTVQAIRAGASQDTRLCAAAATTD